MTKKKEKQKLFNLIICVNFESLRRNALKQTDNNKTFYDIVQRKDLIRNRQVGRWVGGWVKVNVKVIYGSTYVSQCSIKVLKVDHSLERNCTLLNKR